MARAYDTMELFSNNELFVLRTPTDQVLIVDRIEQTFSTNATEASNKLVANSKGSTVHGVLGNIKLIGGNYLIVITNRDFIGNLDGHDIWKVSGVELLAYGDLKKLSRTDLENESRYLDLLKATFSTQAFYFSYTLDLTTNLQTWYGLNRDLSNADELFWWNKWISTGLREAGCKGWIIPLMRGFIELNDVKLGHHSFQFGIISRLGCKRVGTRYNVRGADKLGNVANYVETEQIVTYCDKLFSFLQVRGSIPLKWTQKTNLKYKPNIAITKSWDPFKIHFNNQLMRYNRITIVNLINQTGSENKLGVEYQNAYEDFKNSNINFISFDFHNKTKMTNYGGINELVDTIKKSIDDFGYTKIDLKTNSIVRTQSGILRINCIDCLDRTNVCESLFGRMVLTQQLRNLGIIENGESVENKANLERLFKHVWADNGDMLSNLYAGTNAIKADFTRTGKRTFQGLLNDVQNSAMRYYLNNFTDGMKQDGMNLLLGRVVIGKLDEREKQTKIAYTILQYSLFVGLLMISA